MKNSCLILFVSIIFFSCSQVTTDKIKVKNDLSAKYIKCFAICFTDTVWQVEDIFGEYVKTSIKSLTKYELNELGNFKQITYYKSDGKLGYIDTYEYIDGKVSKIKIVENDCLITTTFHRTNDEIDSICSISNSNTFPLKQIYEKIEENVYKVYYYDEPSIGNYVNIYHYDNNGNLLKVVNGQSNKTENEYFYKNGFLIGETFYIGDYVYKKEYKYDFDDKGSCIRIEKYNIINEIRTIEEITTRNIQYK